eukprot:2669857-Prymnesium_polylepis.1
MRLRTFWDRVRGLARGLARVPHALATHMRVCPRTSTHPHPRTSASRTKSLHEPAAPSLLCSAREDTGRGRGAGAALGRGAVARRERAAADPRHAALAPPLAALDGP